VRRAIPISSVLLIVGLLAGAPRATGTASAPDRFAWRVQHVRVQSHDGVALDGWLVLPHQAKKKRVPVVLWSAPYFGQCDYYPFNVLSGPYPRCSYATGDNPELWDNSSVSEAVPVNFLLEHGYAVAIFNVRGTGNSGGCFTWFGKEEQKDQYVLVQWLGRRKWSNGRVGMMGLSYHGTTPWEAAIQNPPHLKTIVVAGMIGDAYTFSHSVQGATFTTIPVFNGNFATRVSLTPPINAAPEHWTVNHVPVIPKRICEDVVNFMSQELTGTYTDARNGKEWKERRLIDRFPKIKSSVFLTHGLLDLWYSGHQAQEDAVWNTLNAPKRMLVGQWGHEFPNFNTPHGQKWALKDWNRRLLVWLDYWLKRKGERPPTEGLVSFQDNLGNWNSSSAWPPPQARREVLYLAKGKLSPAAPRKNATFWARPQYDKTAAPDYLLCPDITGAALSFLTKPFRKPVSLAGNPLAYLKLSSTESSGLIAVHLFDVGPKFDCAASPSGARPLGVGVADLRFHSGNYNGKDFPVGKRTGVRIDITNFAEVLKPKHRLGVTVSFGDPLDRNGRPVWPQITLHGKGKHASHVVLPFLDGSLGGKRPTVDYPPRPFLPKNGQ
jgi:putative CocE/NonD family hydrolase